MDPQVLKNVQDRFNTSIKRHGEKITIEGVEYDAIIRHKNPGISLDYDDKRITTAADITRGTLITYKGKQYVVISEVNDKRYDVYYEAVMRRVPTVLDLTLISLVGTTYTVTGTMQIPCFVSTMSTTEEGKYAWDFKKIIVIVPDRPEFHAPKFNKVEFRLFNVDWKCKAVYMDTSKPGLNLWHCDYASLS